eukprot:3379927-Amphidinium_carterae.1
MGPNRSALVLGEQCGLEQGGEDHWRQEARAAEDLLAVATDDLSVHSVAAERNRDDAKLPKLSGLGVLCEQTVPNMNRTASRKMGSQSLGHPVITNRKYLI